MKMNNEDTSGAISISDFTEPTAIIRLNACYRPGLEQERFELYETTRGHWSVEKDHGIVKTTLALSVYEGIVLEVYQIAAWLPANSTMMCFRHNEGPEKRMEFVGNIAADEKRMKFLGKSVAGLFKEKDTRRPVACFGLKGASGEK